MLSELRIRNFALIDRLSVRLGPGLNVLTGETGAGKSIIVGALSLLLGERASADVVRAGEERASVEGVFDVTGRDDLLRELDERGLEAEDGLVVLKREVAVEGRNRAWINGSPVTASVLGDLGRALVDLHGQHEHQTLLRRDEQRAILDAYAGNEAALAAVSAAHRAHGALRRELDALEERRRSAGERADFLRFQADEIEKASLKPGEEEELEDEARRLSHSEELTALSASLHQALSAADSSVVSRLGSLNRSVDQLVRIDGSQEGMRELYDTAYYALQEMGERMERYGATVEHDPARLDEIRRRLDLIFRLKSKYGDTLEEVVEKGRAARAELDLLDGAEFEMSGLRKRIAAAAAELDERAAELTGRRTEAMERLAGEVNAVLPELGMAGGGFQAVRIPLGAPTAHGAEEVEFRVALNKGFDPKPISQVASGGELSRLMLALKTILARLDSVPTLIFDEVDTGIGGRVALQVGDKMREVAASHQVFAITHLPQIASRAHLHLLVLKQERDGKTTTEVRPLDADGRVQEIARMLGGDSDSAVSLEHARELIGRAVAV
ncbi:MAG TPA: DNA repair protein RecN [Longimicrobiaceae bacterium]|jgi:DNA repair protein RecN (Recombination protein N)|nr:DNA repair protein RecN [Longimicrobiaceae bacterium]